jgi:NAD(P)-dependent dehydrogenase (short-subunit alcohol dehydrogenase family)
VEYLIKQYPLDNFERIIQINLIGTFRCIVKSAAGMLTLDALADGDRGAIVNTASVAAEDGQIGQPPTPRRRQASSASR